MLEVIFDGKMFLSRSHAPAWECILHRSCGVRREAAWAVHKNGWIFIHVQNRRD